MNQQYLFRHISNHLHTIVKLLPFPLEPPFKEQTFCSRRDFQDNGLPSEVLGSFLQKLGFPSCPVLFCVNHSLFYALVPIRKKLLLTGPVRFDSDLLLKEQIALPAFSKDFEKAAPICSFSDFAMDLLLAHNLFSKKSLSLDDLIQYNCPERQLLNELAKTYSLALFENQEHGRPHNPYDQEVREFTSIQEGNLGLLKQSLDEDYIGQIGTLAKDELRHMKNWGIVIVTLASRAAIRGGLLPEIAFSMSDIFIQKLEELSDPVLIRTVVHQYEYQYAQAVADLNSRRRTDGRKKENPRINQCKDYIFRHLHEKIRIQDIARNLYLNANYLSDLFKQSEGMTITQFILGEKINLTKNLLTYSAYSYSEIAAYLGFSSQSHLGKEFKKQTGMTLREYRVHYGVKKFF